MNHKAPEELAKLEFDKRTDNNKDGDYNIYEEEELLSYYVAGYEAGKPKWINAKAKERAAKRRLAKQQTETLCNTQTKTTD